MITNMCYYVARVCPAHYVHIGVFDTGVAVGLMIAYTIGSLAGSALSITFRYLAI